MAEPWELYQDQSGQKRPEPWDSYLKDERLMAPPVDQGEDIRRAGASGALHGFASLPGAVGDVENLWGNTVNLGMRNLLRALGPLDQKNAYTEDQLFKMFPKNEDYANMPTGQQSDQVFQKFTPLGEEYTGQTDLGKAANWTGRFAPAALGAKGLGSAGLRVGASAGGAKVGGDAADLISGGNEDARMYGQILGGMGGAYGATRGPLARGVEGLDKSIWGGTKRAYDATLGRLQPAVDPNARQAGPGGFRIGPEPPPPEPPPAPIDRGMVKSAKLTAEKFDAEMDRREALDAPTYEFQIYGPHEGVAKQAAMARLPGQAGTQTREVIGPARNALQTRALDALKKMSGGKSRLQANDEIDAAFKEVNAQYEPILNQPVPARLQPKLDAIVERLPDEVIAEVTADAAALAKTDGIALNAAMSEGASLQYMKRALWQYADGIADAKPALAARLKALWGELRDVAHEALPGYKQLDAQFETLSQARDAITLGNKALAGGAGDTILRSDEVAREFGGLKQAPDPYPQGAPAPREGYQVGAANRLYGQIAGKNEGYNPGSIASDLETGAKLDTIFTPEKARPFIENQKLIRQDAEAYNLVSPERGSQTAGLMARMLADSTADAAAVAGGPQAMFGRVFGKAIDAMASSPFEARRNALSAQLLKKVTPQRRAEIKKQLEEIAAEERRALLAQALAASSGAKPPQAEAQ